MIHILTRLIFMFTVMVLMSACNGALPKAEDKTKSPWSSFDEAMAAYQQIKLNETNKNGLKALGFDPYSTPNVKILSYLDVIQKFMPTNSMTADQLPISVRECIQKQDLCMAYEAHPGTVNQERVGNVVLDLLSFKRKTIQTGWRFDALIVLDDGVVVYKIWSGMPIVDGVRTRNNPLGPLQGSGPSLAKDAAGL